VTYPTLDVSIADGIATVAINRPQVLNALSAQVFADLHAVTARLRDDPAVRVVVITGTGDKAFVAGADIKEFEALDATRAIARTTDGMRVYDNLRHLPQPVVAMINGYALGGGMLLAMACDIRIAADTAEFGYPEIRLGIFPATGGTVLLNRLIGPAAARAICLLGERFSAQRAYELGLVNKVVPKAELAAETRRVCAVLAGYSPVAVKALKDVLNASLEDGFDAARHAESRAYAELFRHDDVREGVRAFIEKRPPRFGDTSGTRR
jgi:enoyl-CoA hydratase